MITTQDTVLIGTLTRTHGKQGEVQCRMNNELWDEADAEFLILNLQNILVPFRVMDWRGKGAECLIFQLAGIDSEEKALPLIGADAYMLHVTTTPSVSYAVRQDNFDCGIMITASHNPYYDNGIKIFNSEGEKLDQKIEELIEEYIDAKEDTIPYATGEDIGRTIDYSMGRHRYMGYLISLAKRSFKGVKVGLDCVNGSASTIAKPVFDALGAKTFTMNNEPTIIKGVLNNSFYLLFYSRTKISSFASPFSSASNL